METLQELKEFLISLLPIIIPSIPGIIALYLQRRKTDAEAVKIKAETKKVDAETSEKIQDVYQDLVSDLNIEMGKCKKLLQDVVSELSEQKRINTSLIDTNKRLIILSDENKAIIEESKNIMQEQTALILKQGDRITALEETVKVLSFQLLELGHEPKIVLKEE